MSKYLTMDVEVFNISNIPCQHKTSKIMEQCVLFCAQEKPLLHSQGAHVMLDRQNNRQNTAVVFYEKIAQSAAAKTRIFSNQSTRL